MRPRLRFEPFEIGQRLLAQDAGAIGRVHHCAIHGGDHVTPGVAALDLQHALQRDLFRRDEFHLPQ